MSNHAESNESVSVFDRLSKELIIEILTRIPSKPLCRFKSVSKRFNSLISDPKFLPLYVSRASLPSSWVMLDLKLKVVPELPYATQFQLVDLPQISSCTVNHSKLVPDSPICQDLLQSSNGLLLFSMMVHPDHPRTQLRMNPNELAYMYIELILFVINPITREWVELPKPVTCTVESRSLVGFTARVDPESGLVSKFMVAEYRQTERSTHETLLCFISDTGKWVEKYTNFMSGSHSCRVQGSFEFEGKLFWFDLGSGLITWDVMDNNDYFKSVEKDNDYFGSVETNEIAACRLIPLPEGRMKPSDTRGLKDERWIGGGGGFIQFMEVFKAGKYVLKCWRLKDCEIGSEWNLMYNVSRENVEKFLTCETGRPASKMPKPCFVHPFEADVAYFKTGDSIFSFNLDTQKVVTVDAYTKKRGIVSFPFQADVEYSPHENVLPFVLPKWPSPIPEHLKRLHAASAKEEGNYFFKKQNFTKAIECYSISIDVSPNAASFANRAMAYLKADNYQEADNDCTESLKFAANESLKFAANQFKVYWRRATARKGLGNLKGALEDAELGLKLEPGNVEVMKLHAELKSILDKVSSEGSESGMEDAACGMDVKAEDN